MKHTRNLIILLAAVISLLAFGWLETRAASEEPAQVLRHVVLFKFKDDATPQQIRTVENAFAALPSKIKAIYDFEWGTDVSVESRAEGYTHCFLVTFKSEAAREAYLPHPAHEEFGQTVRPILDKVLVLDYWTSL